MSDQRPQCGVVDRFYDVDHSESERNSTRGKRHGTEPRAPAYSDDALALQFSELHAAELRYVAEWGKWLRYDGKRWQFDKTMATFNEARKVCRSVAAGCNNSKLANVVASSKTVAAVVNLARSDRRHAATVCQWDADEWALNTPDGVIDLRSGVLRQHREDDYFTKITNVSPDRQCPTPVWLAFLEPRATSSTRPISPAFRAHGW